MRLIDLAELDDERRIIHRIDAIGAELGFDHVAYAGTNPVAGTIHTHVTYPDAWKLHYEAAGLQARDPTLLIASRSIAPVDWSRLAANTAARALFEESWDFGLPRRGLTVPVRGPHGDVGLLSVSLSCSEGEWSRLVAETIGRLQNLAVQIHDGFMQTDALTRVLSHPTLSTREREILQWIAAGKLQADIAHILAISARTVEVHLASARRKLFALTTAQAVGRAIALGLIYPE